MSSLGPRSLSHHLRTALNLLNSHLNPAFIPTPSFSLSRPHSHLHRLHPFRPTHSIPVRTTRAVDPRSPEITSIPA